MLYYRIHHTQPQAKGKDTHSKVEEDAANFANRWARSLPTWPIWARNQVKHICLSWIRIKFWTLTDMECNIYLFTIDRRAACKSLNIRENSTQWDKGVMPYTNFIIIFILTTLWYDAITKLLKLKGWSVEAWLVYNEGKMGFDEQKLLEVFHFSPWYYLKHN